MRAVHIQFQGREWVIAEDSSELVCFPALCPHLLGPLDRGKLVEGVVECPWKGKASDEAACGRCVKKM